MKKFSFLLLFLVFSFQLQASYIITSHKTAGLEYPENTLEGFIHSLDLDVQAIEFDVHFTSDKHMVLSHDPVLDDYNCFKKGSIKKVIIAQTPLSEILSIECFNEKLNRNYQVPTLDSVLEAFKSSGRNDIELNFEIKVWDELIENWDRYESLDKKLFHPSEEIMANLTMSKVRELGIKSNILFTTFSRSLLLKLKEMKKADETFRYGLLFKGVYAPIRLGLLARILGYKCFETCWLPNWKNTYKWMTRNKIDVFMPHWPQLSHPLYRRGFKKYFQKTNTSFEIYPWTLNLEEEWQKANEYSFDGMITDEPLKFLDWYERSR